MLLKNNLRILVAMLICSSIFVSSGFGSSTSKTLTDEIADSKQHHLTAIAEQCGDWDYFFKNYGIDFGDLPLVVLEQLNKRNYFLGALKYRDPTGATHYGRDGNEAVRLAGRSHRDAVIDLRGERLRFFPKPLLSFKHLRSVDLCYNGLIVLPKEIRNLKYLHSLNVGFNNLLCLPHDLGKLSSLTTLILEGNRIVRLPRTIGELVSLETLNLEGNRLFDLPDSFGNLSALKFLNLADNHFKETQSVLGQLSKIQSISLRNNDLWAVPLDCLRLATLTNLDLSDNEIQLAIADDVDEYEALKKKAPTCLISISGNINSEGQGQELLRIWHKANKGSKAPGVSGN